MTARAVGSTQERAAAYSFAKNEEQICENRRALRREIHEGFMNWARLEEYATYFESAAQKQNARANLAMRHHHCNANLIEFLFRE